MNGWGEDTFRESEAERAEREAMQAERAARWAPTLDEQLERWKREAADVFRRAE